MPRIVITRPQPQADDWVARLRRCGLASAQALPLIDIAPAAAALNPEQLVHALGLQRADDAPDACMFVSAAAVAHTFAQLNAADFPTHTRFWTVGPATARALIACGIAPERIDTPAPNAAFFDSEALWHVVAPRVGAGCRVVILRGDDEGKNPMDNKGLSAKPSPILAAGTGREWLSHTLRSHGADVRTVAVYERRTPVATPEFLAQLHELAHAPRSVWLFSSAQAADNLATLCANAARSHPDALPAQPWDGHRALATHPRIAERVRAALGWRCQTVSAVFDNIVPVLQAMVRV